MFLTIFGVFLFEITCNIIIQNTTLKEEHVSIHIAFPSSGHTLFSISVLVVIIYIVFIKNKVCAFFTTYCVTIVPFRFV